MASFVQTDELRRLTAGSYEQLVCMVSEAARAAASSLFGEDVPVEVFGTFKGYALVLAEDGRCARVRWEEQPNGSVKIVSHESVKLGTQQMTAADVSTYLRNEAISASADFSKGDVDAAVAKIRALLPLLNRVSSDGPRAIEAMIKAHRVERPWRKIFVEKADVIRRMVLDEIEKIQQDRLQPKFRSLYNGAVKESELRNYRELVIENIRHVAARAEALIACVNDALDTARQKSDNKSTTITSFFAFAEDLVHDLGAVRESAERSISLTADVKHLGQLHDALAENFHDREIAASFTVKMADRIRNS